MPSPGLSLVGFVVDQQEALNHLTNACVPAAGANQQTLIADWQAATARLGAAIPNTGQPNMQPIPAAQQQHAQQILAQPVFQGAAPGSWQGSTVELVEIDKVLAYQMTVDSNRSAHHCGTLSNPPTMDDLMNCCLPLAPQIENYKVFPGPSSLVLKARSLNIRHFQGVWNQDFMGIQFGVSIPYVHVVRYGGRCHLFNGYHRAVGVRLSGATHMPCIVRDVADRSAIGFAPPEFFPDAVLQSNNPPTLAHFTQGRALHVSLRQHSRILHVSWAEHALPDE